MWKLECASCMATRDDMVWLLDLRSLMAHVEQACQRCVCIILTFDVMHDEPGA